MTGVYGCGMRPRLRRCCKCGSGSDRLGAYKEGSSNNFVFTLGKEGAGPFTKLTKTNPNDPNGFYDSGNDGFVSAV